MTVDERLYVFGVIGLLAECGVWLHGPEANDLRDRIEDALRDGKRLGVQYRRILNRFEVEPTGESDGNV